MKPKPITNGYNPGIIPAQRRIHRNQVLPKTKELDDKLGSDVFGAALVAFSGLGGVICVSSYQDSKNKPKPKENRTVITKRWEE